MVFVRSVSLGGGRRQKTDRIDHTAGIILAFSLGDCVREGEPLATLYTSEHPEALDAVADALCYTVLIAENKRDDLPPLIYKVILGDTE